MSCDCYKIGGPWIAEDPDCPKHGWEAQREEKEREAERQSLEDRIAALEKAVASRAEVEVPEALEVPEPYGYDEGGQWDNGFALGWNACRDAMLTPKDEK
jgi:hypothetical protein